MKRFVMAALTGLALLPVMEAMAQGYPPPPPNRDPYKGTSGGVRLAADIVDLVGSLFAPRAVVVAPVSPPPVVVQQPPVVIQQPVTTTTIVQQPAGVAVQQPTVTIIQQPAVVVQQPATVVIPAYTYAYYNNVYVPYYAGWYFYGGRWYWGRPGPAPRPPQWRPNPGPPPRGGPHGGYHR